MQTVNSLSGGKTSSYLAYHYPADLEVFALVCIDSHNAGNKIDPKLKQMVNDKLQKHCSHYPEFVATAESPEILKTMFDLEQILGREIIWLRDIGFDTMVHQIKAIPNLKIRKCTTILKMKPIFEFLYKYHSLPCIMRLGYRYDEMERQQKSTDTWKFSKYSEQQKSGRWINRWEEIVWRINDFPLIDDKIIHYQIQEFWKDRPINFPKDSNCQFCFWKDSQQLRKNFDDNPEIMYLGAILEEIIGHQFKKDISLIQTSKIGIQQDFLFGVGSGCQAGFCTN